MIERYFKLREHNTTIRTEVLCGITTFLTMMYILFINGDILSKSGMPIHGVFVATAIAAFISSLIISLYANVPFAMAPGMGINSFFVITLCNEMGYHWKEALAITFLSGIVHFTLISSPVRKLFVLSIPDYLKIASGIGLGLFIATIGIDNTGVFLKGQISPVVDSGSKMAGAFSSNQIVSILGFIIMIILISIEKKTKERFAALPISILAATFIGIPFSVTEMKFIPVLDTPLIKEFGEVFCSFFGNPGLLSVFATPTVAIKTIFLIVVLSMTNILDSVASMVGVGQIRNMEVFDKNDMEAFRTKGRKSKLDKALVSNAIGDLLSPVIGTSSSVAYIESVTGIVSGGKTGLTGVVVGIMFLMCVPFSGFFHIIPSAAIAPTLIFAGSSMLTNMGRINWKSIEESLPAFFTILIIPYSSILDGVIIGFFTHIVIKLAMGKRKEVHPMLFIVTAIYIIVRFTDNFVN